MKKILVLLATIVLVVKIVAQKPGAYIPCQEMPDLIQHYYADITALQRVYIAAGSPEVTARYRKLAVDYTEQLRQIDFERLPVGCQADYILFKRDLEEHIYEADTEAAAYTALRKWFPFADSIYALEKVRRRGGVVQGQQVASNFSAITRQIGQLNKVLGADKSVTVQDHRRAAVIINGLQTSISNVFHFYNAYDPLFTWWVPDTYARLDSALTAYAATFKTVADKNAPLRDSSGIVGFPIGRQALMHRLQYELIPYTPEELMEIARQEFAWCDNELLKASREMGFGDDWRAAQEKVKQAYVPAGQQPQAMVQLYQESVDFLKQKDLISIPPLAEETWRIVMMSPEQQLVNPFFYGGEEFSVSYPTNTMDFDARMMSMRGNNPHFSRATVHHELIAGHYLQQFMNERVHTYRYYPTAFWTEGWALYWEMTLWETGFPRSPEDRIGMLFWRMHRCARIIFSLQYHLGNWTPQQCIDFLVDRVGHERANAEGEVRRSFAGGYEPLYQVGYMIGGLQFMALRKEILASKKMNLKAFHDAVMQQNCMPVEMLRNILLNKPLTKNYQTQWRFYDK